ncbi:GNAT family N-acetyltransferase [Streptomyces olivoverticillatus]
MTIIDLEPGDERLISDLLPVLRELRPHLTETLFHEVYREGHGQGLRFTAAYTDDGICAGAARLARRRQYEHAAHAVRRRPGDHRRRTLHRHRQRLLAHLERHARDAGCHHLTLDSGTHRTGAHRFYLRERMDIAAFHFAKELR